MSTILDALRRLEVDERRKSREQSLHDSEISLRESRPLGAPRLWLLAGVAVLVGAGVGIGLHAWLAEDAPPAAAERPSAAPPRVASAAVEPVRPPAAVAVRPTPPQPSAPRIRPVASSVAPPRAPETRVVAAPPPAPVKAPASSNGDSASTGRAAGAVAPVQSPAIPMTAVPMRPAEKRPSPPASPPANSPTLADGPLIVVSELPVVAPLPPASPPGPAPVDAAPRAETVGARPLPTPAPVAAAPVPVSGKVKVVSAAAAELAPTTEASSQLPGKATALAREKVEPESPAVAPARVQDVPPPPPASLASDSMLKAMVLRTVWHPDASRRLAYLSEDGSPSEIEFEEGDLWQGWRLVEIKLSGVAFERQGVRRYLRVGQAPGQ